MADKLYTRDQIVRKLKRVRSEYVKRGEWFSQRGFRHSAYISTVNVAAIEKAIAAFPPKKGSK